MKTAPVTPARVEFSADTPPRAPEYGDIYHPRVGALVQARHVFLHGNGLPQRWAGRQHFTVLETGFGLGNNFLATWQAWREDSQRCEFLHFVSLERHPLRLHDLARAHAASPLAELATLLLQAWPPLTPGMHLLDFEGGRVRLLLALGDAPALLPQLRLAADAIALDGFAPARNPQMWQPRVLKALGRVAAPDATAATWSVARDLRQGLVTAGFEVHMAPGIGGKREITLARYAPRFGTARMPGAAVPEARQAVVVGAGLAGAAAAQALARLGLQVTVLEQHEQPAQEASGNLAGLFHGTVHRDEGHHARVFRAAALAAQDAYRQAIAQGVPGNAGGLLRLSTSGESASTLQAQLQDLGLPPDWVQALDEPEASRRAGVRLPAPAWLYPGGGWISPPAWVRLALSEPRVHGVFGVTVATLRRVADGSWELLDDRGAVRAQAPIVVLAHAAGVPRLLADMGLPVWPLAHARGQVSHWSGRPSPLQLPVAGDGYALPLPDGGVLCGATRQDDDDDAAVRAADHADNLLRLQRLTGLQPPQGSSLQGRVGWRLQAQDRLPVVGAVPVWPFAAGQRADQVRLLPRQPGLFVLTALGARGLTLAPLMARLVAAQATGTPWPLEQDLADAVDPARWLVRQARANSRPQPG